MCCKSLQIIVNHANHCKSTIVLCAFCSLFRYACKCFIAALNSTSLCIMVATKVLRFCSNVCCSQWPASFDDTRILCSMWVCFTRMASMVCFSACATSTMRRGEGGGVEGRGEGGTARRLANQIRIHTNLITYTLRIPSNAIQVNTTNPIQINTNQ